MHDPLPWRGMVLQHEHRREAHVGSRDSGGRRGGSEDVYVVWKL
ncbi:hypothetical protein [Tiger frog virus]|uniref:Uncharacterized protein n=1 Tax=Rana tigrina ranavirus TaxID=160691 RepID=Q2WEU3_RTRV|nr:hypothetical protein [Tiger frog virus]